jgi:hypothetical protein
MAWEAIAEGGGGRERFVLVLGFSVYSKNHPSEEDDGRKIGDRQQPGPFVMGC